MTLPHASADKSDRQAARWRRAHDVGLTFRPSSADDLPLLARVYASSRADELMLVDWSDDRKAAFVEMQFNAQHQHYRDHYPDAEWLVIQRGDDAVGRLYLERWSDQIRIIDITFLADHRGHGLGGALLRDILDEAAACGRDVSIHVEKFNPAQELYKRLGFVVEADKGVYDLMRWTSVT